MTTLQNINSKQSDFIQVRLDSKTKKAATSILDKLGMSPSQAIKMFLNQVIITRGIPFSIELPVNYVEELSEELSNEVGEAINQISNGDFRKINMSDKKAVKKYLGV